MKFRRKSKDTTPHTPFWKDERSVLGITSAGALRLLISGVVAVLIVLCLGGVWLINLQEKSDSQNTKNEQLSKKNSDLIAEIQHLIKTGHANRLADQARMQQLIISNQKRDDMQIRNLACLVVSLAPVDGPIIERLNTVYKCGVIKKTPAGTITFIPSPGVAPTPTATLPNGKPKPPSGKGHGKHHTSSSPSPTPILGTPIQLPGPICQIVKLVFC